MHIPKQLFAFLNSIQSISKMNILITNLDKIILALPKEIENSYVNQKISLSLKRLLSLYQTESEISDYLNTTIDTILPLVSTDNTCRYASQIILPFYEDISLIGTIIFFSKSIMFTKEDFDFALKIYSSCNDLLKM